MRATETWKLKKRFLGVLGFWPSALGRHVKGPLQGVGKQLEVLVGSPETIQPIKKRLNDDVRRGDCGDVGKPLLMAEGCRFCSSPLFRLL